jgi:hypothetical protein
MSSTTNNTSNRRSQARISTSITINNRPLQRNPSSQDAPTSATASQPSISLRLGQLFRSSLHQPQTTSPGGPDIIHIPSTTHQDQQATPSPTAAQSFTDNPNNYFDFSLFNRSQIHENSLLLDRLFDIPEDVQQMNSDDNEDVLGGDSDTSSDEEDLGEDEADQVPDLMTIPDDDDDDGDGGAEYEATSSGIDSLERNNDLTSDMPQAKKQKTEST